MTTNTVPKYDMTDNPTGCCPRFQPEGWDDQQLHFEDKLFLRAKTRGVLHIPLNMGSVFEKTFKAIEQTGANSDEDFLVMSRDLTPWSAEHLFAVTKDVPGNDMVRLSGDFVTKVFEGPYKEMPRWHEQAAQSVRQQGKQPTNVYFFYTTCPKCAKSYGKNYVVSLTEVS